MIKSALNKLFDLVFPVECIGCSKYGDVLCSDCEMSIEPLNKYICPVCLKNCTAGQPHKECPSYIDGLFVSCLENKLVKSIVYGLKYESLKILSETIAEVMIKKAENSPLLMSVFMKDNFVLLPVPLHRKKQWDRGFNQTELISIELSKRLNCSVVSESVKRTVNTKSQTRLSKEDRYLNTKNIFSVYNKEAIYGKDIIIIDDVITTGSTLNSLAKTIKQAGLNNRVYGLVFAKAL